MKYINVDNCLLCDSSQRKHKFSFIAVDNIEFKCYKCKNCGLVYASPIPLINEESLNEIYGDDYYENYYGNDLDYFNKESSYNSIIIKELKNEYQLIKNFVSTDKPGLKVLDFGCGDGRFLENFNNDDWKCFGIDASEFISVHAHQNGIKVIDEDFLEIDPLNHSFDCLIMDNVIEHLDYPAKFLKKSFELLDNNGVLVLKTPNSSAFTEILETSFLSIFPNYVSNFLMQFLKNKFNVGSGTVHRYGNLHPPVHLAIFNKKSIIKALELAGFETDKIKIEIGSEYYHKWRVKEMKPRSFLGHIMKYLKQLGDVFGLGNRLFVMVKK